MSKILVRRANVELTIDSEDKEYYMSNGFSVIENGIVVERALPNDVSALKIMVANLQKQLDDANDKIKKLETSSTKKTTKSKTAS